MKESELHRYRSFLKDTLRQSIDFRRTDQSLGVPPPVEKSCLVDARRIDLAASGEWKGIGDVRLVDAIGTRRSHRQYRKDPLTLDELAFLLWATQGIHQIVSEGTALRTVPSAGCRHAFETYLCVLNVEGLAAGLYRYLPVEHQLMTESSKSNLREKLVGATFGQSFIGTAPVTFVWTVIPYRMEWRYGPAAHRVIALDAGHVCQNLYLACAAVGAGTCAVAAYDQERMDDLLGVDGMDEFTIYLAPVGKIRGVESGMTQHTQLIRVLILLIAVCLIGVSGYMVIEKWSILDALFMTIITLTTVGFEEVRPLSTQGRVFTIFFLLIGVGVLLYGVSTMTAFIVEGDLRDIFRKRKRSRSMKKQIDELKDHYIICGAGEIGKHVLNEFFMTEKPFIVIERNPEVTEELRELEDVLIIEGNADDDEVLRRAGIEKARGLISVLPEDKDNLFTIFTARTLNPHLRIVTKAVKDRSVRKLKQAGADSVVLVQTIGGLRIASEMLRPAVVTLLDSMMREHEIALRVEDAKVESDSPMVGKTLAQSQITQKTGLAVIAVKDREQGKYLYNPGANYVLHANDILFVVGDVAQIEKLREMMRV